MSIALLLCAHCGIAQRDPDSEDSLPVQLPQVVIEGRSAGVCLSADTNERARNTTLEAIRSILRDTVVPLIDRCPCGGPGPWRRIAYLDMSDPNQQCPSNLRLITTPVRACGRTATSAQACESLMFPSNGFTYSRMCGRVNAIQRGNTNAFWPSIDGRTRGLDGAYIGGISLTHGAAGSRQHIWSFVAALYETDTNYNPTYGCACSNTESEWPYDIPSFVGSNYFCDTGNRGPGVSASMFYPDDPMWDGDGCGPTSTCCQLSNPPWFCTTLPQPTTDDLEVRICGEDGIGNEDILTQLVDIYVM